MGRRGDPEGENGFVTSESKTLDLRGNPDADLSEVVEHIRSGGVVAYPTETVYGLGGACTPEGVQAVRAMKRRPSAKPLIALVESAARVEGLTWTDPARELASIFWPGSVTLVLSDPEGLFPEGVRSTETGTVAVRVSPHPLVARLLAQLGGALTSTSLNAQGERPASSGSAAREILAKLSGPAAYLLDVGTLPPSGPSTVVDCTGSEPVVLREGTVPVGRLRCVLPGIS